MDEAVLMSPLQFYCPNKGFKVRGDDRSRIRLVLSRPPENQDLLEDEDGGDQMMSV